MNQNKLGNKIIIGIVFGLLLIILFSNAASAAHTLENSSVRYATSTTWVGTLNPNNLSYTAGTGSSVMVLGIVAAGTAYRTNGTPTFNGKSFINIGRNMAPTSPEGSAELWYLLLDSSDTGSAHNVSVPDANAILLNFYVATFISSTGASALDAFANSSGTWANPNNSVTTTVNGDAIVSVLFSGAGTSTGAINYGGIQLYVNDPGAYFGKLGYKINESTGTNFSGWTVASDDFALITAAFKEAGSLYNISGYITDKSSGSGLNNATVKINSTPAKTTTTNATGYYNFSGISNGTYLINASLTGYVTNSTSRTISGADVINHNISLSLIPTYLPPTPEILTSPQNNFWVNYTWQAGAAGNITNSYNVSHNGSWTNNTITFRNNTVGPHGWSNITIYAYNSSGTGELSQTPATMNTQVTNNVPVLAPIGNKVVTAGQLLTFTNSATDADSDTLTNATNATKGSFTPSTGVYTWTPTGSDVGTYLWEFNTSDNYGGIDSETITVTVNAATYIPPSPTITEIFQGNFWINYSWLPGLGFITDSYNVSVNGGAWTNGTTETYSNTSVGAHGWSNITIFAFNNSGSGSLSSAPATSNTQVANNVPVQTLADTFSITAGNMLTFPVSATDADSDTLSFSTNATGGTLNQSTGVYSWMPSSADTVAPHFWSFSSNDGYGGIATNTTTITVTNTLGTYINGTVRSGGNAVEGIKVSTNTSINTTTDAYGFYSLPVSAGAYELTAAREPVYYTNSSVTADVQTGVVVRDIELLIKPTGTITGSVTNV